MIQDPAESGASLPSRPWFLPTAPPDGSRPRPAHEDGLQLCLCTSARGRVADAAFHARRCFSSAKWLFPTVYTAMPSTLRTAWTTPGRAVLGFPVHAGGKFNRFPCNHIAMRRTGVSSQALCRLQSPSDRPLWSLPQRAVTLAFPGTQALQVSALSCVSHIISCYCLSWVCATPHTPP